MPKLTLNIPLPVKGLTVDRPGEFIDSREQSANKNVSVRRMVVFTRPGMDTVGSALGERVQRIFEFEEEDGNTNLLRIGLTKVEKLNKSTNVWADIAGAALNGTEAAQIDYAVPILTGEKVVTFTNGIDAIRKYTGTGTDADLGGTPPKAKYMVSFGSYLLIGNITDDGSGDAFPYRVKWSDTGDIEEWVTGNAGTNNLLADEGDITGMSRWGNFVTVHKANSIYVGQLVTTATVFRFDRKATGAGAVNGKAIANLPTGEQLFLASDGLRLFNGITAPLIPSPMQDELRDGMNPAELHKAEIIIREELDEAWIGIPIGSETDITTIYKYNYRTGEVHKDARTTLTTFGLYLSTTELTWDDLVGTWDAQTWRWNDKILTANNPLVMFGRSDGETLKESTGSDDDGVAVESQIATKDFTAQDFGIPDFGRFFRFTRMEMWALGSDMTVEYSTDSGGAWTSITNLSLSADYPSDDSPLVVYFDVLSTKIRFRFSKDGLGESFTLKKYYIEGNPRERRR